MQASAKGGLLISAFAVGKRELAGATLRENVHIAANGKAETARHFTLAKSAKPTRTAVDARGGRPGCGACESGGRPGTRIVKCLKVTRTGPVVGIASDTLAAWPLLSSMAASFPFTRT